MLYIVGVGRSGTSLLQSMFASHASITFMPETGFLRKYASGHVLNLLYVRSGISAVVRKLANDNAFARTGLEINSLVQQAVYSRHDLDNAIYLQMVNRYLETGSRFVGDKDPRMIEFMPLLASLSNDIFVINIIRDPRDILLSKKTAAWSRHGHIWKHIFANRIQLRLGRFWGPRLFGDKYVEVLYEDLITCPSEVLSSLCDQINIPFDSAMLSFNNAAKKLVSFDELSWKKETMGPLICNNKEKWRTQLSDKEILLTELCCKEAFVVGGYIRKDGLALSWFDKIWVLLGAALIFTADKPYQLYRNYRSYRYAKSSSN